MIPNKPMAFVDFESEFHAAAAKDHLQGFALTADHKLVINFVRQ